MYDATFLGSILENVVWIHEKPDAWEIRVSGRLPSLSSETTKKWGAGLHHAE